MEKFNIEILSQIIKLFYGFENEQSSYDLFISKRIILNRSIRNTCPATRRYRLKKDFVENGFSAFNELERRSISMDLALIILEKAKRKRGIERIPYIIKKINMYISENKHNENFDIFEMISEISATV